MHYLIYMQCTTNTGLTRVFAFFSLSQAKLFDVLLRKYFFFLLLIRIVLLKEYSTFCIDILSSFSLAHSFFADLSLARAEASPSESCQACRNIVYPQR